jgi:hypothetical protein
MKIRVRFIITLSTMPCAALVSVSHNESSTVQCSTLCATVLEVIAEIERMEKIVDDG